MFCPKCGGKNDDDSRFCDQCGNNLASDKTIHDNKEDSGARTKATIAIAGVFILLLIIFAIFWDKGERAGAGGQSPGQPLSNAHSLIVGEWEPQGGMWSGNALAVPGHIVGADWFNFLSNGKMKFETGTPDGPTTFDGKYELTGENIIKIIYSPEQVMTCEYKIEGDKLTFYIVNNRRGRIETNYERPYHFQRYAGEKK